MTANSVAYHEVTDEGCHGGGDHAAVKLVTIELAHSLHKDFAWAWWVAAVASPTAGHWTIRLRHDYPDGVDPRDSIKAWLRQKPGQFTLQVKQEESPYGR